MSILDKMTICLEVSVFLLCLLEEVSSVFEKCQFVRRCILWKKNSICAKSDRFWAIAWLSKYSDEIMSCKLLGKVTVVFVNINFGAKMSIFCNFVRNFDFFIKCAILLKVIIFLKKTCLFLENDDFLCEGQYKQRVKFW